jgi:hypothetical protein
MKDPTAVSRPSMGLHNMEYIPGHPGNSDSQPISYTSQDSVIVFKDSAYTVSVNDIDFQESIGPSGIGPLAFLDVQLSHTADLTGLDPDADSAHVYFRVKIESGDNVPINEIGDYDPKYTPIDFRVNDSVRMLNHLTNYYAYDDGTAEYGIGLNQPGTEVAYLFNMVTPDPDTIVAIDLYFPRFGDESSQSIQLLILNDLSDDASSILYQETIPVLRSEQNRFIRHTLITNTTGVQGSFYIGWSQTVAATIAAGL